MPLIKPTMEGIVSGSLSFQRGIDGGSRRGNSSLSMVPKEKERNHLSADLGWKSLLVSGPADNTAPGADNAKSTAPVIIKSLERPGLFRHAGVKGPTRRRDGAARWAGPSRGDWPCWS